MGPTPDGRGYWLLASDGGIFTFGRAGYFGSAAASGAAIVGFAIAPDGRGYWMVSRNGRVFAYGSAPFYGDIRSLGVNDVVGIATTSPPLIPDVIGLSTSSKPPAAAALGAVDRGAGTRRAAPRTSASWRVLH